MVWVGGWATSSLAGGVVADVVGLVLELLGAVGEDGVVVRGREEVLARRDDGVDTAGEAHDDDEHRDELLVLGQVAPENLEVHDHGHDEAARRVG